jgi:hypothetical protein
MCVGIHARALWRASAAASGEGCGRRRIADDTVRLATFYAAKRSPFAYGRAGERVAEVRVRFSAQEQGQVPTYPTPIPPGGRGRFWVLPARGDCPVVSVQALEVKGQVLAEQRIAAVPPPPRGAPDPSSAR